MGTSAPKLVPDIELAAAIGGNFYVLGREKTK